MGKRKNRDNGDVRNGAENGRSSIKKLKEDSLKNGVCTKHLDKKVSTMVEDCVKSFEEYGLKVDHPFQEKTFGEVLSDIHNNNIHPEMFISDHYDTLGQFKYNGEGVKEKIRILGMLLQEANLENWISKCHSIDKVNITIGDYVTLAEDKAFICLTNSSWWKDCYSVEETLIE